MGPLALALIGAGIGALRSKEEKNIWSDQQKAEAEKSRYAPWTGQWGQNLKGPTGDISHVMGGAATGFLLGKGGNGTTGDELLDDGKKEENSQTSLTDNYDKIKAPERFLNQSNISGAATGDTFEDWLARRNTNVEYLNPYDSANLSRYSNDQSFEEWLRNK